MARGLSEGPQSENVVAGELLAWMARVKTLG